jgi:TRAP-type mannitol/chloroaromatic compound transport system permease small subunit
VALGTVGILFYAVLMDAAAAYQRNETLPGYVEYPIWPTKFIMVIGLVFFLFQILVNVFDAAKKLKKR